MEKYKSPFPGRLIVGNDFNELVDYINAIIDNSNLTEEKLKIINKKVEENLATSQIRIEEGEALIAKTNKKHLEFESKLDAFYAKQIELFGLFIAIFSFIIIGIQIATKAEGTFLDKLATSTAIFIPITISITILFYLIKRVLKK